jgi:hypothetical protein
VTHLRKIMLEELQRRHYSEATTRYYIRAVEAFSRHFQCPPDVLQLSGRLAGDVKELRNGNPTRDLQMAADRARPDPLSGPVVSSLFSFAARC